MRNAQRTTAYIAADKRVSGVEQTLTLLLQLFEHVVCRMHFERLRLLDRLDAAYAMIFHDNLERFKATGDSWKMDTATRNGSCAASSLLASAPAVVLASLR